MADYLKKFATQSDYDAYIQAGYPKPNVSYIVDNDEIIFTNYQDGPAGPDTVITGMKIADFTGTTFNDAKYYITEAYIPEGVTSIGQSAFANCTALTSVTIPDGVTTIGQSAFNECTALTSMTIPNSVTLVGGSAFQACRTMTSVNIPASVTTIAGYTFNGCRALPSVDIPASVTSIGVRAFQQCTALTSVTVRATTPPTLDSTAFDYTNDTFIIYVPAASVEAYKAASGWSAYASRIQAITE